MNEEMKNKAKQELAKVQTEAEKPKATVPQSKLKKVSTMLGHYEENIIRALGSQGEGKARKLIESASLLIAQDPKLLKCDAASIVSSVIQASALDLDLSAKMGYVYFIPRKGKVEFQISYKGLIELALRTGMVARIDAHCVYECDHFEYELGARPKLIHKPSFDPNRTDYPLVYAYAVAEFTTSRVPQFAVLDHKTIESLRKRADGQYEDPRHAWSTDYDTMAKAKAVRQLMKYLPTAVTKEYIHIIKDDKYEVHNGAEEVDGEPIDQTDNGIEIPEHN